jgi:hypothetical protein
MCALVVLVLAGLLVHGGALVAFAGDDEQTQGQTQAPTEETAPETVDELRDVLDTEPNGEKHATSEETSEVSGGVPILGLRTT